MIIMAGSHSDKRPILIAIAFLIALVLNIVFNWAVLCFQGRSLLAEFHPDKMASSSDKFIYLERKKTWPILFLGSSQVHWGVNPADFERLDAFNLGMKGTYFKSQDFILNLILRQGKKPPLVVLECSPILTNRHQNEFIIKKDLMPYLVVRAPDVLLNQIRDDWRNGIKLFDVMQTSDIIDWLSIPQDEYKTYYNRFGFEARQPLSARERKNRNTFLQLGADYVAHYQFDEVAMTLIIQRLKRANIPVVFIQYPITPVMRDKLKKAGVLDAFDKSVVTISRAYGVPYWNLNSIPALNQQYETYFVDGNHLNRNGARILSKLLEKKLSQYAF
jgi:hypothetical protein